MLDYSERWMSVMQACGSDFHANLRAIILLDLEKSNIQYVNFFGDCYTVVQDYTVEILLT